MCLPCSPITAGRLPPSFRYLLVPSSYFLLLRPKISNQRTKILITIVQSSRETIRLIVIILFTALQNQQFCHCVLVHVKNLYLYSTYVWRYFLFNFLLKLSFAVNYMIKIELAFSAECKMTPEFS